METIITAKNLTLDEAARKQIERKFSKIGRHLPQARELRLDLFEEATKAAKDRFVARGFLDVLGPVMTSECRAANLITAVDQLVGVMERQAQDFKNKNQGFDRESQRFAPAGHPGTRPPPEPAGSSAAVDAERVRPEPMTVAQAIDSINDTKDDFLLFRNPGGGVSLLLRREEGGLKLIEIETG